MGSKYPEPDPLPVWWDDADAYQKYKYRKNGAIPTKFKVLRCEACLAPFKPTRHSGRQITCSDECAKAVHLQKHQTKEAKAYSAEAQRKRLKDPANYFIHRVRVTGRNALRNQSSNHACSKWLGCTKEFFRDYLLNHPNSIENGYTVENYGSEWHIDHIVPLASFDLRDEAEVEKALHYTNCQPLGKVENLKKGSLHNGKRHYHKESSHRDGRCLQK